MTTKVTKESLEGRIRYLESVSKLGLSLSEEYQLEAYRMLLERLTLESTLNAALNSPAPAPSEKLKELMNRVPRYRAVSE